VRVAALVRKPEPWHWSFTEPTQFLTALINLYGRNVISSERADAYGDVCGLRHRVTRTAFSERIHAGVWSETHGQASSMLQSWQQHREDLDRKPESSFIVSDPRDDTPRLGMHIITGVAYGATFPRLPDRDKR
jgi:hypothetical protein